MNWSKELTIPRVFTIYTFGLITGIQIALYMYDFYDDGIADFKSLLIGIVMFVLSIVFILYSFRNTHPDGTSS